MTTQGGFEVILTIKNELGGPSVTPSGRMKVMKVLLSSKTKVLQRFNDSDS
jgi:hypothetical protein